jgi:hypothetical protein
MDGLVPWLIVLTLFILAMLIPAKIDPAIRLKERNDGTRSFPDGRGSPDDPA